MSPIDAGFVRNMKSQGVLDHVDALAVHGFPLDWNHWQIGEWPARLAEIQALTDLPGAHFGDLSPPFMARLTAEGEKHRRPDDPGAADLWRGKKSAERTEKPTR
jgi:hypothetical protein